MISRKKKTRPDFILVWQKGTSWYDVQYPLESKPRYMINSDTGKCTCSGASHGLLCKHVKRLFDAIYGV